MKYDLVVVGAGPAGLMAAATAATEGLKVLLIEKRRNITEVRRTDAAILYLKFIIPDEYIEPITVEIGSGQSLAGTGAYRVPTRLNFLGPGFSLRYTGPLLPYYNFINL
ncbi:MAG: NAD(P)/FAD-dependent oxidoreductase, partial [Dehalococcoidia bacterium]|nr:NAD(P)/FAD-dependent oxidoreductase [Dehalococcoidia bacterium]